MAHRFRDGDTRYGRPIAPTIKLSSQAIGSRVVIEEAPNHSHEEVVYELTAEEAIDLAESLLKAAGKASPYKPKPRTYRAKAALC